MAGRSGLSSRQHYNALFEQASTATLSHLSRYDAAIKKRRRFAWRDQTAHQSRSGRLICKRDQRHDHPLPRRS